MSAGRHRDRACAPCPIKGGARGTVTGTDSRPRPRHSPARSGTLELQALPPLTEAQFQQRVVDLAKLTGWHCVHYRPAWQAGKFRTPLTGDRGAPDLILARRGVVLLAELKTDRGRLSPEQKAWLAALGPYGRVWRPRDWPAIVAELTARDAS